MSNRTISNSNISITETFDYSNGQGYIWTVRFIRSNGLRRSAPCFSRAEADAFAVLVRTNRAD
tara:strand:+ start:292 stop:480 length:189 start_codon:yes stop_codon:yes gene_type:complete